MEKTRQRIQYKIYVAKDEDGKPLGVIISTKISLANAYFKGKYPTFDSIQEININKIESLIQEESCYDVLETYDILFDNGEGYTHTYHITKSEE